MEDKIKFICFNCNAKLEIENKYAGKRGKCPTCKAKNTIPSPDDTIDDGIIILFKDIEEHEEENNKEKDKDEDYLELKDL